jgi:hypothetical protein
MNLNLTVISNDIDWKEAVKIFDDRYLNRFINPILTLANNNKLSIWIYSGFAIMTLNCLLIETLNQFYYGVNDTNELIKDKSIKHINSIEDAFFEFLTKSNYFNTCFKTEESKIFYKQVRCGLLHQAETKGNSTIHIKSEQTEIVVLTKKEQLNVGVSIRRDLFTTQLIKEYNNYMERLLLPVNTDLRKNFISKMKYICDNTK